MNQKQKSKPKINQVVVVEGKSDTQKLKNIFNVRTIETNGSRLSSKTMNLIRGVSKTSGIILFLDPDGPGEKIRKKIQNELDSFQQVFIKKPKNTKKVGVAEASDKQIIDAFKSIKTFNKNNNSISLNEYKKLNLNTRIARKIITDHLKISECNNKQLFKRLNMMNVSTKEVKKILKNNQKNFKKSK